jgi:hypothetical protein
MHVKLSIKLSMHTCNVIVPAFPTTPSRTSPALHSDSKAVSPSYTLTQGWALSLFQPWDMQWKVLRRCAECLGIRRLVRHSNGPCFDNILEGYAGATTYLSRCPTPCIGEVLVRGIRHGGGWLAG